MEHLRSVFTIGGRPGPRGVIAEWTITILLVFFGTTTLVQAYVIPTNEGLMMAHLALGWHARAAR